MKFVFSLVLFASFSSFARAEIRPPHSYTLEFNNGKHLLDVLSDDPDNRERTPLNKLYAKTGLYRNDGSRDPIWTMPDYFDRTAGVILSKDGTCLANVVYPAHRDGDGICFFKNGQLVRAYKIKDLTRPDSIVLMKCPSDLWQRGVRFDEAEQTIFLECNDGRRWRFGLRTAVATQMGVGTNDRPNESEPKDTAKVHDEIETGNAKTQSRYAGLGALVVVSLLGVFLISRSWLRGRAAR